MKIFSIVILIVSFSYAIPNWYYNLKPKNNNEYIGYGSAKTIKEAKSDALSDIASQINTKIVTDFEKDTHLKNENYSKQIIQKQKQTSSAILSDYKILKLEYNNGKYFIAISYENIPAIDKFVKKAKNIKSIKNPKGYIYQTSLAKEIFSKLNKKITLEIFYKNQNWYLKSGNDIVLLNKENFLKLFNTIKNPNINLKINKNPLFENEIFYFKVKPKQNGYITLFDVYDNGETTILFKNIKVEKNKTTIIPPKNAKYDLIAGVLNGEKSYDLFVVIFSKNKKTFDEFALADEEFSKNNKNFDDLIKILHNNFSSIKVLTKKR